MSADDDSVYADQTASPDDATPAAPAHAPGASAMGALLASCAAADALCTPPAADEDPDAEPAAA